MDAFSEVLNGVRLKGAIGAFPLMVTRKHTVRGPSHFCPSASRTARALFDAITRRLPVAM